jgi:hypothetical protein
MPEGRRTKHGSDTMRFRGNTKHAAARPPHTGTHTCARARALPPIVGVGKRRIPPSPRPRSGLLPRLGGAAVALRPPASGHGPSDRPTDRPTDRPSERRVARAVVSPILALFRSLSLARAPMGHRRRSRRRRRRRRRRHRRHRRRRRRRCSIEARVSSGAWKRSRDVNKGREEASRGVAALH